MGWSKQEIVGIPEQVDPLEIEGKGEIAKYNQDEAAFLETGIECIFPAAFGMVSHETFGKLLYAATGEERFKDTSYLWKVGERIWNLERAFNVREGFDRENDTMPKRIREEPVQRTGESGFELKELSDQYYEVRDWDKKTEIPKEEKLQELELERVAKELKNLGKLPK